MSLPLAATILDPVMAYLESRQRDTTSLLERRAGGGTGSGTLIAIICLLAFVLLGTAVGFVLLRRFFQARRQPKEPIRTFVGDRAADVLIWEQHVDTLKVFMPPFGREVGRAAFFHGSNMAV
ncbi:hypothetical protein E8E14_011839 [Neopestalotiopsis sp. 37M]|nr:hypothetical protein E8E14_011839 [Neopestalotiopsis sp. 37M]